MKKIQWQHLPWILLTIALFILIPGLVLLQKRMSADGTLYASIAWNMAHGIGSMWQPVNAPSVFPHFYEHPPLGMYVHSLFIRVFGDHFMVDRLYCFFTLLLSIAATFLIQQELQPKTDRRLWWLMVFAWVSVPLVTRTYGANAIEDLLVVFSTFSVWAIIRAIHSRSLFSIIWLIFGSALIVAGFFANGLQALFPFVIPLLYAFCFAKRKYGLPFFNTCLLVLFALVITALIFIYFPASLAFTKEYFKVQVLATFSGARVGNGNYKGMEHLIGLGLLLANVLPLLLIVSIFLWKNAKKTQTHFMQAVKEKFSSKLVVFYFLTAMAASLPILASSRQMAHYFLQAFPFLILLFLVVLNPLMTQWIQTTNIHARYYKMTLSVIVIFLLISCVIAGSLYGRSSPTLQDVTTISTVVPNQSQISVTSTVFNNWNLHAYLYRYHQIDLSSQPGKQYFLKNKTDPIKPAHYREIVLPLHYFVLYKKTS